MLQLEKGTMPHGLLVITTQEVDTVFIGAKMKVSFTDFSEMVKYFLSNTPLMTDDARLQLLEEMRMFQIVERKGKKYLKLPDIDNP